MAAALNQGRGVRGEGEYQARGDKGTGVGGGGSSVAGACCRAGT